MIIRPLTGAATVHPQVLVDPEPQVLPLPFGDSTWNVQLLGWFEVSRGRRQVQSDIHCAIVRKFRDNGVGIPFPSEIFMYERRCLYRS